MKTAKTPKAATKTTARVTDIAPPECAAPAAARREPYGPELTSRGRPGPYDAARVKDEMHCAGVAHAKTAQGVSILARNLPGDPASFILDAQRLADVAAKLQLAAVASVAGDDALANALLAEARRSVAFAVDTDIHSALYLCHRASARRECFDYPMPSR